MAFGRDGSELELMIYDLQNKRMIEALETIIEKSRDPEIILIARAALEEAERLGKKLDE